MISKILELLIDKEVVLIVWPRFTTPPVIEIVLKGKVSLPISATVIDEDPEFKVREKPVALGNMVPSKSIPPELVSSRDLVIVTSPLKYRSSPEETFPAKETGPAPV